MFVLSFVPREADKTWNLQISRKMAEKNNTFGGGKGIQVGSLMFLAGKKATCLQGGEGGQLSVIKELVIQNRF